MIEFNLLDARLVLDDDDVLKVSLSTAGQGIDPLRSAGFQADEKFVRVAVRSVPDVMTIQVAMETLLDIFFIGLLTRIDPFCFPFINIPWSRSIRRRGDRI